MNSDPINKPQRRDGEPGDICEVRSPRQRAVRAREVPCLWCVKTNLLDPAVSVELCHAYSICELGPGIGRVVSVNLSVELYL